MDFITFVLRQGIGCETSNLKSLEVNCRVVPLEQLFEMLEPYEGKLSRTVLRREWGGNAPDLSGVAPRIRLCNKIFYIRG